MIFIKGNRIVDLTHTLEFDIPRAPGFPDVAVEHMRRIPEGSLYNLERVTSVLHLGTHIDAQCHYVEGGHSVAEIPVDVFVGSAVVVDMRHKKSYDAITADDIKNWEQESGEAIQKGDAVLIMTDHHKLWKVGREGDQFLSAGWAYVAKDAAEYLRDKGVRLVGVEPCDIDDKRCADVPEAPDHIVLLSENIYIVENVANLDQIGVNRCDLIMTPLKIKNATASPLRLIAIVEDPDARA